MAIVESSPNSDNARRARQQGACAAKRGFTRNSQEAELAGPFDA